MRLLTFLVLVSAGPLVTACGSVHLYNKNSDDSAVAAKADYEASKLGERVKHQRAVLKALDERDVASSHKLDLVQRDQDLVYLMAGKELSSPNKLHPAPSTKDGFAVRFLDHVDDRITKIDRAPEKGAQTSLERQEALAEKARAQESQQRYRKQLGMDARLADLPPCDSSLAALKDATTGAPLAGMVPAKFQADVAALWPAVSTAAKELGAQCASELAVTKKLDGLRYSGMLGVAVVEYEKQLSHTKTAEKTAKEQKAALKLAADELAQATKTLAAANKMDDLTCPNKPKDGEQAEGAAPDEGTPPQNKLCNALARLQKLGGLGDKIISEEKIERIGHVLQALSGVDPAAQDGKVDSALALISASTRLRHALRQYRGAGKWPALESLIIEKQLAEAQLESANARLALDKARLGYHAEQVAALEEELFLLGEARATLAGAYGGIKAIDEARQGSPCTSRNAKMCATYEALLRTASHEAGVPAERQPYRALAQLSESYSGPRVRHTTASTRLALSGYQESLIRSEEALASWKALFDTPIDLLRQYHAGGLKPADLAPLLQTIGIFSIAHRIQ